MRRNLSSATLLLAWSWSALGATAKTEPATLTLLTPEGRVPDIFIDLRASPAEKFAATELKTYLAKITGRTFRVRMDYWLKGVPEGKYIAVGHSKLTSSVDTLRLATEQYVVDVTSEHVTIVGARDRLRGVLYGVYEFLEGLGVRWYRPEPWGEHVPKADRIELPIGKRVSEAPHYQYRSVVGGGFSRHAERTLEQTEWGSLWALRNRMNGSDPGADPRYGGQVKPQFGHAYYQLIPVDEYFDTHPEFFCLYKGERRKYNPDSRPRPGNPTGLQLCLSNPGLQDLFARKIIAQAKATRDLSGTTFSVTPNDACPFCECADCRKMDDPEHPRLMSNRVCAFTNIVARRLAESVPGARVSLNVYSSWTAPPTVVDRLEPNIVLHIALINEWADYTKKLADPAPNWNHKARDSFATWKELGATAVMTYEYWSGYGWLGPLPLGRTMADRMDRYRQFSIRGIYNETSPHWGPQGLELYLFTKLVWDPDLDTEKELDLYYRNYYGPAAEPMKAYHEALMDALERHPTHVFSGGRGMHLVCTPRLVAELGRHMTRAQTLVEGDALYGRRLRGVWAGYEFARRVCEILRVKKTEGVRTDVGGMFAGRGSYLKSAKAERMYDELVDWVKSLYGGDSTFDVKPDPPYFHYVKQDVLENAAVAYEHEERLLADF